jgi:signal peptidase I
MQPNNQQNNPENSQIPHSPNNNGRTPGNQPVYPEPNRGVLNNNSGEPKFATNNQPANKKKKEDVKNAIYTILLFILAPIFAIFIIVFVLQSYIVDGSSMTPTLENGNRVFIYKLPKTMAKIKKDFYIPSRGEVIVFKKPSEPETQLIKRVIGLPGERVVVKDNTVRVYNAENPDGFDPDAGTVYGPNLAQTDTGSQITDIIVGENELFVMGDNRTPGGSLDSHSGLGLVPVNNIVGRLWVRYFPLNEITSFR